jgi:hypothetical protein
MTCEFDEVRRVADGELLSRLERLVKAERALSLKLLVHLGEVEVRKLYLERGYSSMYSYCMTALGMSEAETYLRLLAAKTGKRFPLVLERLAEGGLHLTAIKLLAPLLTESNHVVLLDRARGMSKRQLEVLVAELAPKADVPERMRKLPESRGAAAVAAPGASSELEISAARSHTGGGAALHAVTGIGALHVATDGGTAPQAATEGGALHAATNGRAALHAEIDGGAVLHAATEGGAALHAATEGGAALHAATDGRAAPHAATDGGASLHAAADGGCLMSVATAVDSGDALRACGVPAGRLHASTAAAPFVLRSPPARSSISPLSPGRFKLELTLGQEAHDQLEQLRELLRHQNPSGEITRIVERALRELLECTLKRRFAQPGSPRRQVARAGEGVASTRAGAADAIEPPSDGALADARAVVDILASGSARGLGASRRCAHACVDEKACAAHGCACSVDVDATHVGHSLAERDLADAAESAGLGRRS